MRSPEAPRESILQDVIDPATGTMTTTYVPISDFLAVSVVVAPQGRQARRLFAL